MNLETTEVEIKEDNPQGFNQAQGGKTRKFNQLQHTENKHIMHT